MSENTAYDVTMEHKRIIESLVLVGNPGVFMHKRIAGFGDSDGDAEEDNPRLTRGIHIATMGEDLGRTFSNRQDMRFGTIVVLCEGSSTTADIGRQQVEWRRKIIDAVHNRRATRLSCELYTQVRLQPLRMTSKKARKQDYIGFEIWSYFRESR